MIPTDSKWHYVSLTANQPISLNANAGNVNNIIIWLMDYSSCPSSDFEIRDIQIEVGEYPTDYESYDKTAYARVNGNVLRVLGDSKDSYSYNEERKTGTITRNVLKVEIKHNGTNANGNLMCWENTITENSIGCYYVCSEMFGSYPSPTFKTENAICSHFDKSLSIYNESSTNINTFCPTPSSSPPYIGFRLPFTTLNECIEYFNEQYNNGAPITVWLQRISSVTETV